MFVDGQKMVGSELQQSKLQNCIQEELYLHIVGYSCVNFADSMSFLPMEVSINEGSGQGSVCSPVISCVYMHYVLVWWFKEVITLKLKGYAGIVVYADDFVVTFQYKTDAEWFYEHLKHRMGYFGLSLEEEKNNKQYFTRCKVVFYRI